VPLLVRVELPDSGQGQVSARATCSVENRPSLHAVLKASHLYQGLRRFESPVAILQAPCSEDSLSLTDANRPYPKVPAWLLTHVDAIFLQCAGSRSTKNSNLFHDLTLPYDSDNPA